MSNLRDEFESAYWDGGVPSLMVGPRDSFFAKKDDGSYRLPHVDGAWWGWRAKHESVRAEVKKLINECEAKS